MVACCGTLCPLPAPSLPLGTWLNKMSTQMLVIEMRARWQLFACSFFAFWARAFIFMGLLAGDCVLGPAGFLVKHFGWSFWGVDK